VVFGGTADWGEVAFPFVGGRAGPAGGVEGCGGDVLVPGVCVRLGADAVRVAEGFSTMRMGSRSAASALKRDEIASGGLDSAETEMRGVAGGGAGGCLAAVEVGG